MRLKATPEKPSASKDRQPTARSAPSATPAPASAPAPALGLSPGHLRALQRSAGNAAVSRLVAVQRYTEPVKPPPSQSPGFRKVEQDVAAKKTKLATHKPAATESKSSQDAAVAPPDDVEAQGKAANAEKMNEAKPGEFDKAAFIAAVNEAIDKQAPKNLEEADEFGDSGKADEIKDSVDGKVTDGKESSAEDIATTTEAPPDTSQAEEKQVTPMEADQPPANPGAPNAQDATPEKQPPEVTDFSEGPAETNQKMTDAEVTEEQLAKGNEPEFDEALSNKKSAEDHSAKAPTQARTAEDAQLNQTKATAAEEGAQAMNQLTQTRQQAGKQVDGGKGETKSKDEKRREEVTSKLQRVFDTTKKDVENTLNGLDKLVDDQFTAGEKTARDAFTADHERRMKEYKDKRYGGFFGPAKWAKDKLLGMPEEANEIYQHSRRLYVNKMQGVISGIADTIGRELGKAKDRIAQGRNELKAEVDKLPADLKQFGQEAAADFTSQFDDLESQVNDKSKELVNTLAQKYTEALNAVDEEIKKLQEANKGLVQKAIDAVVGVIKTILELKDLLLGILAKAASAVMKIIKDPIGFLGNLVRGLGQGLENFISNILTHLQTGLVSWLLGTAVRSGIEIPSKFDLKGIIQLIASLLGLTWDNIRAKIVRKGVPEQAMTAVESSVPVAQALAKEGPAGAVEEIKQDAGDMKQQVLDDLKSYLVPTVIIAGITWIMSLLTPASAFIRAVKGIIDIVTFIVTQGAQIMEFVNSVLDAVIAIADGDVGGAPKLIEQALANSIPLLIGFLAALVGVGGLANKVKSVFQKLSRPVNRAIDKIITKIANAGKKLWNKLRRKGKGNEGEDEEKKFPYKFNLQKPFDMHEESHTLYVDVESGGAEIEMASSMRQRIGEKIERAKRQAYYERNKASRSGDDEQAERMVKLAFDLEDLEANYKAAMDEATKSRHRDVGAAERARIDRGIQRKVYNIISKLTELGVEYRISNLEEFAALDHQSDYVENMHIKPEYRNKPPKYDEVRRIFYGGWDGANDTGGANRVRMFNELHQEMVNNPGHWNRDPLFGDSRAYYCPECRKLVKDEPGPGQFTLDHEPPMVNHWNNFGIRTTQDERHRWFNDVNNLQGICNECNGRKSGRGEKCEYRVEPSFRGPDQ
jgi:hypothetical protein